MSGFRGTFQSAAKTSKPQARTAPRRPRADVRDRGLVSQRLQAFRAAVKDLTESPEREPQADDFEEIRARVLELNAPCSRLN